MEIFILTLAEFAETLITFLVTIAVNVVCIGLDIFLVFLEFFLDFFAHYGIPTPDTSPVSEKKDSASQTKANRFFRKILIWGMVAFSTILLLIVLSVVIINTFFFESAMRFALHQVDKRTNIAITFDKAHGSFWTGHVRFEGISVKRQDHPTSCFDLKGKNVELDLDLQELTHWSVVFKSLEISEFSGTWHQIGKSETLEPRRKFRIVRLAMNDVQLDFTDETRKTGPLRVEIKIDTMVAEPLRSNWAAFDILFRSKGNGRINDIPFLVDSEPRRHSFRMDDVPIDFLVWYLGMSNWFETGKVDLAVENQLGDGVTMHWSLVFRDFRVKVREDAGPKEKILMTPLIAYWNRNPQRLPLEFELRLNQEEFHLKSTAELGDTIRVLIGDEVTDSLKKTMGQIQDKFPIRRNDNRNENE